MRYIKEFIFIFVLFAPIFVYSYFDYYTIHDVGTLGTLQSEAIWINDKNEVLGKYYKDGKYDYFIWSKENGLRVTNIPSEATVIKMNSEGKVLFYLQGNEKLNQKIRFYIWGDNNNIQKITNEGADATSISDMNDKGFLVGIGVINKTNLSFIWDNNHFIQLESLYDGNSSYPIFINNNLDVVGFSYKTLIYDGKKVKTISIPVIWRASNNWKVEELPILNYDLYNAPHFRYIGFNDSGKIIYRKGNDIYMYDINYNYESKVYSHGLNIKSFNTNYYLNDSIVADVAQNPHKEIILSQFMPTKFSQGSVWLSLKELSCVNSHGYAVGKATTIFGKVHGILFVPSAN